MPFEEAQSNLDTFRDCLSGPLVQRSAVEKGRTPQKRRTKGRKNSIKPVKIHVEADSLGRGDVEELAEFIEVSDSNLRNILPQLMIAVPCHRDIRVIPKGAAVPILFRHPKRSTPRRKIWRSVTIKHTRSDPDKYPTIRRRISRDIRPTRRTVRSPQLHYSCLPRVHRCRNSRSACVVHHPHISLRDLRAGLDTLELPSSDPEADPSKSHQTGLA